MQKTDIRYTEIRSADDVTDEVIEIVLSVVDGWYQTGRIDWEDLLDRVDGNELADGSKIDFGCDMLSEAIRKVKTIVQNHRRNQ